MFRLALIASLLAAAPAQAFIASNGLVVEAEGADTFYVPYRGQSGAPSFWCAAGEYAQRKLGAGGTDLLWRLSEPPRRSGQGIRFSLNPAGHASSTGLFSFGSKDGSLTVAFAQRLCERNIPTPVD